MKSFSSLFLSVVLVLSLNACGSEKSSLNPHARRVEGLFRRTSSAYVTTSRVPVAAYVIQLRKPVQLQRNVMEHGKNALF